MTKKKIYKPTNDYVFSRIFGYKKNWELLKDLLEAILTDIQIKKIELVKQYTLDKETIKDRGAILDVLAVLNDDTTVNIEMQMTDYKNTIERSIFNDSGVYHESLMKNDDFKKAKRVIGIWILCYNIFDDGPFHEIARLKRDYENILLTNKMEFHYIQLPKFKEKCKRVSSKLEQWLTFLLNEDLEEIKMIDNEFVQKAEDELEYINADEEERMRAKFRERAEWKYHADMKSTYSEGKNDGIKEGLKQGIKEQKITIAKNMLAEKIDIHIIAKTTGLTIEEIENLKNHK